MDKFAQGLPDGNFELLLAQVTDVQEIIDGGEAIAPKVPHVP